MRSCLPWPRSNIMLETSIVDYNRQRYDFGSKMHKDARNLIAAVSKAVEHKLDVNKFDDRLAIQKGCYILNNWGYGPEYRYSLYIRGPYSSELADDYYEIGADESDSTDVPPAVIEHLSEIFEKGLPYVEAYATVMLIMVNNPGLPARDIRQMAIDVKPHLESEVVEASTYLLN